MSAGPIRASPPPAADVATVVERIREHARKRPGVAALETASLRIDYGRLPALVDAQAAAFAQRGLAPGDLVALVIRDEAAHLVASLALLRLGVAQMALASHDTPAARARLAGRAGATAVLADDRDADAITGTRWAGTAALPAAADRAGAASLPDGVDPDAPALYLTGSGTTGVPKILAFSQRDLALQAERSFDYDGQRALRPAHVEFNNSKRMRFYVLWQGGTCVLAAGSARTTHALCADLGVTKLECSSLHAASLVAASAREGRLPAATELRVGGSRMPWTLRRAILADVCPRLHVSYGTTETSLVAMAGPGDHDERESVGRVAPGAAVEVLRDDGTPAPPGEPGEVLLRTPGMARGYVGDDATSARYFRDGRFAPGDRVSIGADGMVVVHGRSDDMMIMNGVNIFPLEIERVLEAHPAVAAAAAFPVDSGLHGQIPVAAVELRAGSRCSPAELVRHARGALGVRAPRRVLVLDALPRNAQGKILRRDIARAHAAGGASRG